MDVKTALRELSEPWPSGSYVKSAIERSARLSGLSYSRCFEIWYGRARRIESHEIARIGDALELKNRKDARNELQELRTRIAKIEARLATADEDFYRPTIDWLGKMACRSG